MRGPPSSEPLFVETRQDPNLLPQASCPVWVSGLQADTTHRELEVSSLTSATREGPGSRVQSLDAHCLGPSPGSDTHQMCDPGRVVNLSEPQFPSLSKGNDNQPSHTKAFLRIK